MFGLFSVILQTLVFASLATSSLPGHSPHLHERSHSHRHRHFNGTGSDSKDTSSPCTEISCTHPPNVVDYNSCPRINGTSYTQETDYTYTIICDIDFPEDDIYPFILAGSFNECLKYCDNYNRRELSQKCVGFVFAPDRVMEYNDCYLKSSLARPTLATIHLIGALRESELDEEMLHTPDGQSNESIDETVEMTTPWLIEKVKYLGTSTNTPTIQYINHPMAFPQKLSAHLLTPGINTNLITDYPLADDTGIWTQSNTPLNIELANLKALPRISRDGGKGGTINGTHVFVFCDTAVFTPDNLDDLATMVGFVSSSVATDTNMDGLYETSLHLVDNLGQWQDDVGRMRGFAPMTTGEEAFNIALSGDGYRYAVWPESSLIPLNSTHALLYASLVYDEVNMDSQSANFTTLGNTLLLVSIDPRYGPFAQRLVKQLFKQGEITFGSLGGIREWGTSGVGGNDGHLYLFGQVASGVMVARVSATEFTNLNKYEYFNGTGWIHDQRFLGYEALMLTTPVMDVDVIYAPALKTFIMIYLNTMADNTFYMRYLATDSMASEQQSPSNNTDTFEPLVTIIPAYERNGTENYVESIIPFSGNNAHWSKEYVLYKVPKPVTGYIYAGALHAGYYGADDITLGGRKMLLSWTEHTGEDAASEIGGYAHKTALVVFGK